MLSSRGVAEKVDKLDLRSDQVKFLKTWKSFKLFLRPILFNYKLTLQNLLIFKKNLIKVLF